MKKNKISNFISIIIVLALGGVIYMVVHRNNQKLEETFEFTLETPYKSVIENKKMVRGQIIASQTVNIQAQISGVVEQLFVKAGDHVSEGDQIAKIKVIPSPEEIKDVQKELETAKINFELDKTVYEKNIALYKTGGISQTKIDELKANKDINEINYKSTQNRLNLLLKSTLSEDEDYDYTLVKATSTGTVLEIPIKVGTVIDKRNSSNEGTPIITMANLDSLVFESKINESYISKVHVGMTIDLQVIPMGNLSLKANIIEISPLSTSENGVNKFQFLAKIIQGEDKILYSGITATAEILFEKTDSVLCINEKYLQFDNDKSYVEIWKNGENQRKDVSLGISDGINIEIKKGLNLKHRLLLPSWDEE